MEAASAQRKALEQCVERARSAGAGATLSAAEVAQKKKLADQGKQLQKQIDVEQAAVDKADAAIAALQEQVLAAGGMKLRAQKSKLETLAETLACVQQQQTKIRGQSEIAEKAEAKLQAGIAKLTLTLILTLTLTLTLTRRASPSSAPARPSSRARSRRPRRSSRSWRTTPSP